MIDFGIPETAEIHPRTPMKLKIEINTNKPGFLEDTPAQEIDYVLQGISQALKLGIWEGPCHDHKGNTCGRWSWS